MSNPTPSSGSAAATATDALSGQMQPPKPPRGLPGKKLAAAILVFVVVIVLVGMIVRDIMQPTVTERQKAVVRPTGVQGSAGVLGDEIERQRRASDGATKKTPVIESTDKLQLPNAPSGPDLSNDRSGVKVVGGAQDGSGKWLAYDGSPAKASTPAAAATGLTTAPAQPAGATPAPAISPDLAREFASRTSRIFLLAGGGGGGGTPGNETAKPTDAAAPRTSGGAADYLQMLSKLQAAQAKPGDGETADKAANGNSAWADRQQKRVDNTAALVNPAPGSQPLLPGMVINLVTLTTLRSDLPGEIIASVVEDVYDSIKSRAIIIPKGSRVIGAYNNTTRAGQQRAMTSFSKLYLPDGRSFDLRGAGGSDREGAAGLIDEVENHYFRNYGVGLLTAVLAYALDRPSAQTTTSGGAVVSQQKPLSTYAGPVLADTTSRYLDQYRGTGPTIIINKGHQFVIVVNQPMLLTPL